MPFNVVCSRCNALMATIERNKVRDYTQIHQEEICKNCITQEASLRKFFEKQKNVYITKLERTLEEAIQKLDQEVKELAVGNDRAA